MAIVTFALVLGGDMVHKFSIYLLIPWPFLVFLAWQFGVIEEISIAKSERKLRRNELVSELAQSEATSTKPSDKD